MFLRELFGSTMVSYMPKVQHKRLIDGLEKFRHSTNAYASLNSEDNHQQFGCTIPWFKFEIMCHGQKYNLRDNKT